MTTTHRPTNPKIIQVRKTKTTGKLETQNKSSGQQPEKNLIIKQENLPSFWVILGILFCCFI